VLATAQKIKRNILNKKVTNLVTFLIILCFNYYKIVRVIAKKTLRDYWEIHNDCEDQLKSWYNEAENAYWKTPKEVKKLYPTASILPNNRVVFNINGNNYRLIVKINYTHGLIWIRFIGTHSEYDKIDASNI
jgi:mRNA interferase HigB